MIAGGLLAGVIINAGALALHSVLLHERWTAAFTALSVLSCSGPKGKSQLTKARLTPRRTALQTTSISSNVTSNGFARPHKLMPTESPTRLLAESETRPAG